METGVDTSALYYYVLDPSKLREDERNEARRIALKLEAAYERGSVVVPAAVVLELSNILHFKYGRGDTLRVLEGLLEEEGNVIRPLEAGELNDAFILSRKLGVKYSDCLVYLSLVNFGVRSIITADKEFSRFGDLKIL